jgi:hypothetical protein
MAPCNKTEQEINAEFAAMSPEEQQAVRGYRGLPLGSAMDLYRELQGLSKSQERLREDITLSIKETTGQIIDLLGDIRADLKIHEHRLGGLEHSVVDLDKRLTEITGKVQRLSFAAGVA